MKTAPKKHFWKFYHPDLPKVAGMCKNKICKFSSENLYIISRFSGDAVVISSYLQHHTPTMHIEKAEGRGGSFS